MNSHTLGSVIAFILLRIVSLLTISVLFLVLFPLFVAGAHVGEIGACAGSESGSIFMRDHFGFGGCVD